MVVFAIVELAKLPIEGTEEPMPTRNKVGRPLKYKDVKKLQEKIEEYFKSCWEQKLDIWGNPIFHKDSKGKKTKKPVLIQKKPYTVGGLAVFLDTSRETLVEYEGKKQFVDTIKKAKDRIYAFKEESLYTKHNPTGVIFDLKNNDGWKDKIEEDHRFPDGLPIEVVSYRDVVKEKNE